MVGTRAGAIPEIIEDGRTGLLVRPQSPVELADAIVSLLKDPAQRTELGDAGRLRWKRDTPSNGWPSRCRSCTKMSSRNGS